jgi:hypothetical protein
MAGIHFPAPVLSAPANGAITDMPASPTLSWSLEGGLGSDDFFFVEIFHAKGTDPYYVRTTSLMPRGYLPDLAPWDGALTWRVTVVHKTGDTYSAVSPPSNTLMFKWTRFVRPHTDPYTAPKI